MNPLVIPILALLIPIVVAPTAMWVKYAQRQRELEHAERIRALELGRTLPKDEAWWTLPRISVAIGAGVPAAVFFCAWQAGRTQGDPSVTWVAASVVGLAAVVCGSGLSLWHFSRHDQSAHLADGFHAKPQFDADAYDVVSSRG